VYVPCAGDFRVRACLGCGGDGEASSGCDADVCPLGLWAADLRCSLFTTSRLQRQQYVRYIFNSIQVTTTTTTTTATWSSNLTKGRIAAAHEWYSLYFGPPLLPQNCLFPWRIWASIYYMVPWAHPSSQPKGHLYRFSRSAGLTIVTNRQTDRQTDRPRYSVCNNRPYLRR